MEFRLFRGRVRVAGEVYVASASTETVALIWCFGQLPLCIIKSVEYLLRIKYTGVVLDRGHSGVKSAPLRKHHVYLIYVIANHPTFLLDSRLLFKNYASLSLPALQLHCP